MFNTPVPPDTLVTRQIECISCKEIFTIAEDDAVRKRLRTGQWRLSPDHYPDTQLRYQRNRTRRSVTPEARSDPALNADRFLNFQPERRDYINCPRCGADNRNWLHIAAPPSGLVPLYLRRFPLAIIGFVVMVAVLAGAVLLYFGRDEPAMQDGLRRNLALILSIFLAGFLPLILIPMEWRQWREHRYLSKVVPSGETIGMQPALKIGLILFGVFVLLVPFILFILVPWVFHQGTAFLASDSPPALVERIDQLSVRLPGALGPASEPAKAPARNAMGSLERLVLEQRFLGCESAQIDAMIGRLHLVRTSSSTAARRETLIAEALADLQALRDGSQSRCRAALITNAVASLELLRAFDEEVCDRLRNAATCTAPARAHTCWAHAKTKATPAPLPPECNTALITGLITELRSLGGPPEPPEGDPLDRQVDVLRDVRQLTQESVDAAAVQRIESNVGALEKFVGPEEQGWFTAGRDFLRNWFWLVGFVSLTSMLTSLFATEGFERGVDHHLPRPIFYSVANMTRVVIWEAKRSLELDGDMGHVCWTKVERNDNGGIILHGLHYDVFDTSQKVDPLFQKVRAQHYRIATDPWGRIQSADIRNVHVARPPQDPGPSIGSEFFQHVPVPPRPKLASVSANLRENVVVKR